MSLMKDLDEPVGSQQKQSTDAKHVHPESAENNLLQFDKDLSSDTKANSQNEQKDSKNELLDDFQNLDYEDIAEARESMRPEQQFKKQGVKASEK